MPSFEVAKRCSTRMPLASKKAGRDLSSLALVAAGAAEQQRFGREEVGVAEQVVLAQRVVRHLRVVQALRVQRAGEGRVDLARVPAAAVEALFLQPAGHVVQQLQQHGVAQQRIAGQRARGAWA